MYTLMRIHTKFQMSFKFKRNNEAKGILPKNKPLVDAYIRFGITLIKQNQLYNLL